MEATEKVTGAVMAGGSSRRMGHDKRWVAIDGVSLMQRALDCLDRFADELMVVGGLGRVPHPAPQVLAQARVVGDERPDAGPLAGIETALLHATDGMVVVLAVDHPWARPAVLELLVARLGEVAHADAVLLGTSRGPQPLVGAYRSSAVTVVSALLDAGERRATALTDAAQVVVVDPGEWRRHDPTGATARDVDTPDDLSPPRKVS